MPQGKPLGLYILNPDICTVELKIFNEKPSICTGAPVMREAVVVTTDLIIRFLKIVMQTKEMAAIPAHKKFLHKRLPRPTNALTNHQWGAFG